MANTYAVVGERLNHLFRVAATPVVSPAADSLYGISNLYDGFPGVPFRFGSVAADPKVTIDLNTVLDPGFEVSPITNNGWSTTGTVGVSVTSHSGAQAATITTGGSIFQDILCRAGEKIRVEAWTRQVTAASGTGTLTVQNLNTGKFWDGAAWSASGNLGANTGATYVLFGSDMVVEDLATTLSPIVTLRITVTCTGGGSNTLVDDVALWPWTDWISIHGTKYVDTRLTVTLRSSTDNFGAVDTVEATLTVAQPSFWTRLGALNGRRYWRVQGTGTPAAAPFIGELVLSQAYVFTTPPAHPGRVAWSFSDMRPQKRSISPTGNQYITLMSAQSVSTLTLQFLHTSETEFQALYREIARRSDQGAFPLVLAPDSSQPRVIYGVIEDTLQYQRIMSDTGDFYISELKLTEQGQLNAGL